MENVFKPGDTIYHPSIGKGEVTNTNGRFVYFIAENGENVSATVQLCSFSPWNEPNHIRPEPPVKEGWWLMHVKEDEAPLVRYVSGKSVYALDTKAYIVGEVNDYVFIRYLGQDWKEEAP